MCVRIQLDPEGLASTGAGLGGSQAPSAPGAVPAAGSDPVSQGTAAILAAHAAALSATVTHSGALRAAGGAAVIHTAATLQGVDEANAGGFTGAAQAAEVAVSAASAGAPPLPDLAPVPALPPPPVMPGEAFSAALHSGPGSAGLRDAARSLRAQAASLRALGDETRSRAASIDAQWLRSAGNPAAANTLAHGWWLDTTADQYETLAAAADSSADDYDHAAHSTPRPEDFARTRNALQQAAASANLGQVALLQAEYARMQAEAIDAATAYHGSAAHTAATIAETPKPAPPITRGSGDATAEPLDNTDENSGQQDKRAMPVLTAPGALGPPNSGLYPGGTNWIEVGPGSGVWLPEDELDGVVITAPGALGPAGTGLVPGGTDYVELIPDSGVWLPRDQLPGAIFQTPGSLGPPGTGRSGGTDWVEWLPGSGIWLPGDEVYQPGPW